MYQWLKHFNLTNKTAQKGFTLIEMFVVMGIFAILVGLATLNLNSLQRTATLGSEVEKILTEIKQQQIKAMVGDSEGSGTQHNYGVHLATNSYTMFQDTYSAGNSSNFVVNLPSNIQISSGSDFTFQKGSGELTAATSFTLIDTTNGQTKTISINKYGVITGIN